MGRRKVSREVPVEDQSQETPDPDFLSPEESIAAAEANGDMPKVGAPSKAQAVRNAMDAGMDDIDGMEAFIKREYGIEMPRAQLSAYASQQRAKQRKASGEPGTTTRQRTATQPMGIPAGFSSDVRELREVIEKLGGADETKEMIGQLSGLIGKYGAGGLSEIIDAIA